MVDDPRNLELVPINPSLVGEMGMRQGISEPLCRLNPPRQSPKNLVGRRLRAKTHALVGHQRNHDR